MHQHKWLATSLWSVKLAKDGSPKENKTKKYCAHIKGPTRKKLPKPQQHIKSHITIARLLLYILKPTALVKYPFPTPACSHPA
jgi:hypothetical protein